MTRSVVFVQGGRQLHLQAVDLAKDGQRALRAPKPMRQRGDAADVPSQNLNMKQKRESQNFSKPSSSHYLSQSQYSPRRANVHTKPLLSTLSSSSPHPREPKPPSPNPSNPLPTPQPHHLPCPPPYHPPGNPYPPSCDAGAGGHAPTGWISLPYSSTHTVRIPCAG